MYLHRINLAFFSRSKPEANVPLNFESSLPEPEQSQSNSDPCRSESTPTPEPQPENLLPFSETSALLDHLKRSELFRSTDKSELFRSTPGSELFRSTPGSDLFRSNPGSELDHFSDHYRNQLQAASADPFRPLDDQDSVRGSSSGGSADYYQVYSRAASSSGTDPAREQFSPLQSFQTPGLPIDYSQHVSQRETYTAKPQTYLPKPNLYGLKNETYSTKTDGYPLKPDDYPTKSDGYPPISDDYLPKSDNYPPKSDGYRPKSDGYPPKSDCYPEKMPADRGYSAKLEELSGEHQKINQETYFRYVTSQLHEFYNRRQGGGDLYGREPADDYTRPDDFSAAATGNQRGSSGADMFGGYRRQNFH